MMETLATIPPASHIVKYLHLKSRLPRRDGDVTICTQCSLDRLERLEAQTNTWSGVISVAVMCPCPCSAHSLRAAKQSIWALHVRVEARGGPCRLDIILLAHSQRRKSDVSPCRDPWQYPINALRNVALQSAATELVILLDVDFLPGWGIQEQLWKMDIYIGYLRACCDFRRVVVLPALEESSVSEASNSEWSSGDKDHLRSALQIVTAGKVNVERLWSQRKLRAFAADEYPRGHGPTDTQRWVSSAATYEVQYEVDYEPYFLCARRMVPWYDERFTGYGKNKIIHAFHTAVLDFRFWVHPEWFVVHVHHPASSASQATLGRDPLASERLSFVKLLYEGVKHELLSLPSHSGVRKSATRFAHGFPGVQVHSSTLCPGQMRQGKSLEEQMGHWDCADKPSPLLLGRSTTEYVQALYDLRYHFRVPKLRPVGRNWPLYSKLPRQPRDISLVTVATADRLHRLAAQCRRWKGVVCAAIYASYKANVRALEEKLAEFHLGVENAGICRLDLILLESVKVDKGNCCYEGPILDLSCQRFRSRAISSSDSCPINALRNAALGLATTDLVLLLDVDLLPAPSLNDCFLDEQQYKCLWEMAMKKRTAVVVPTFEYAVAPRNTWPRNSIVECPTSQLARYWSTWFERGKFMKPVEKESRVEELRYISDAEELSAKGVHAICKGVDTGSLCGFHLKHYCAGHSPTDFDKWRENSTQLTMGDRQCCEVCRSYSITFAEGFEPFTICSRKLIPRFDERFQGYGYDKVAFFYHLHLSGFGFRVLLHSFALDIPHAKSQDWMQTFGPDSDPLQRVRVKALYQRAKRELNLICGVSALADKVTGQLPVHLMGKSRQSTGFHSRRCKQWHISHTLRGSYNRPALEGLQLAWQGAIGPLCGRHTSSIGHQAEGLSYTACSNEEGRILVHDGVTNQSQEEGVSKRLSLPCENDELIDGSVQIVVAGRKSSCFSGCLRWKDCWVDRLGPGTCESSPLESMDWVIALEELDWDSAGWWLKCSTDSLVNCSVVEAVQNDQCNDREPFQTGGYWLRISMSAGSWSPQASRLAGITTGGVSVRSVPPIRSVHAMVVCYMVRFPSSFNWTKGGTLPGVWVSNVMKANFGWRRAGEGHFSSVLVSQSDSGSEKQNSFMQKTSIVGRPFYFVPGQWHALHLAVSVGDGTGTSGQEDTDNTDSKKPIDRKISIQALDFEDFRTGAVLVVQAFVDFELVNKIVYLSCKQGPPNGISNSREPREAMGLLLSCYFGGKTQEWATAEDTHIDFCQFEVWTDSVLTQT